MVVRGHVKWFDTTKGYGFVVGGDGEGDILLHSNVLRAFGFTSVAEGAEISLRVQTTDRGRQAVEVLEGIEGLEMVRFDSSDVVRHSLVSAIVDAYDAARGPAERSQKRGGARRGR